jgi:DNA invertase Pin-like site-specific DNA recombinase
LGEPPQELLFAGGLYHTALAEKERRMIPQRTKDALRAAKTRGVILGNAKQAEANRSDADAFAESLRPIVAPFIHLSSRRIAKVLNDRGIKSPTGKAWQSVTVLRLVERLKGESRP